MPRPNSMRALCALNFAACAAIGLLAPLPASAQQALEEIVITANRTPSDINKVGSTVEVISREELDKQKQTYLKDYLERLPGVTFGQNGPPGSAGTFQIRGALGQYVKILIDGIDISDLASTQSVASFEHLLVDDIERIEVLKGPQSTLYGSEAVGGVISVTTRRAKRGLAARANVETGSYNTKRAGATVSYGTAKGDVSFTAQGLETSGFSAADENAGNTERDGYHNRTFSGRAQYRFNETLRVFFAARSTNAKIQTDGFPFPAFTLADDDSHSTFDLKAIRGGAEVSLFDGRFVNTFSLQRTSIDREVFSSFPGVFESDRTKYEYKGVARFSAAFSMLVGADYDQAKAFFGNDADAKTTGLFAQALVEPIKNLNFTAGVRHDDHSNFGTFDTYRLTGAYYIPKSGTKLRATYGTAFRAPSLYELNAPPFFGSPIGNPDLKPEDSEGWDAGIDQTLNGGKVRLSATYFDLNIGNLIQYTSVNGYQNVSGTTNRRGVELSGKARLTSWLATSVSYTYTDAEAANGQRLIRVPRHVYSVGLDMTPIERLSINATAHIVRDTLDIDPVTFAQDYVLDDYVLINAKVTYAVSDDLSLYVRGENLLNQEYQTIQGYGTSDLAVYAGLTLKLNGAPSSVHGAN
jgi:vitamin B12 transporter